MTNSRIGKFNNHFNLKMCIYNDNDRHIYPRNITAKQGDYVLYNYFPDPNYHVGHYCLLKYKSIGITEIINNFKQEFKTPTVENIKRIKEFKPSIKNTNYDTYIWDSETYKDENFRAMPYSTGLISLFKVEEFFNRNEEYLKPKPINVTDKHISELKDMTKIFITPLDCVFKVDDDCITQMFKYLGTIKSQKIVLIAHNSSRFDSFLPFISGLYPSETPIKTSRGILNMKIINPYTTEEVKRYLQLNKKYDSEIGQKIIFRCSLQHFKTSLANACIMFDIPKNLSKTNCDHDKINKYNYLEVKDLWYEYLKFDVISLASCVVKYNLAMEELFGFTLQDALTISSMSLKAFYKHYTNLDYYIKECVDKEELEGNVLYFWENHSKEVSTYIKKVFDLKDNLSRVKSFTYYLKSNDTKLKQAVIKKFNNIFTIYSHTDPFIRKWMRKSVKGGRVYATRQTFESNKYKDILRIIKDNINENDLEEQYELRNDINNFTEYDIMDIYMKFNQEKKETIANKLKEISLNDVLMAFDGNSLYPSAMIDEHSYFPKVESARLMKSDEAKKIKDQFNTNTFKKSGIFQIEYENDSKQFLQHLPSNDKTKFEGITRVVNRFRNGIINDTLSSVDIIEIIRYGGKVNKIYCGIIYEENYEVSPFEEFIKMLYELRLKYKNEGNKSYDEVVKLIMNSLYGKTIQKDVTTTSHLWNYKTLANQYDDSIKSFEPFHNNLFYVEKKER